MRVLLLAGCLALGAVAPASAQSTEADEAPLRALIVAEVNAWNAGDSTAWAATFTEDASFVNIRGDMVHSRQGVLGLHRFIFAGPFKGSHLSTTIGGISFPAPDVALIETVHEVTHYVSLPPGVTATGPGVLRTRMKYIATRRSGAWLILAAQNTAIVPKAAGFQLPPE